MTKSINTANKKLAIEEAGELHVYQIAVTGQEKNYPGSQFRSYSKNVYLTKPSQEEIDKFVEKCTIENGVWSALDTRKPFNTHIIELDVQQ